MSVPDSESSSRQDDKPEPDWWTELSSLCGYLFNIWFDSSELDWAREAVGVLFDDGLITSNEEFNPSLGNLAVVALAQAWDEFSKLAWNESADMPLMDKYDEANVNGFTLAIVGGPISIDDLRSADLVDYDESELVEEAVHRAIDSLRSEIHASLVNHYGSVEDLYSRMWRAKFRNFGRPEPSLGQPELFPADEEVEDVEEENDDDSCYSEGDEFEPCGSNLAALNFVQQGFET